MHEKKLPEGPWKPLDVIAAKYNIALRTLQEWMRDNKKVPIRCKRKVGKEWRIHEEKFDKHLELKGGA